MQGLVCEIDSAKQKPLKFLYLRQTLNIYFPSVIKFFGFPQEWKIGPTVLTLCEHLFVSFAIRMLRKQAGKLIGNTKWKGKSDGVHQKAMVPTTQSDGEDQRAVVPAGHAGEDQKVKFTWRWGIVKFVLSGVVAYVDGRLCRNIPNPLARRIVSGFLLSFLDKDDK